MALAHTAHTHTLTGRVDEAARVVLLRSVELSSLDEKKEGDNGAFSSGVCVFLMCFEWHLLKRKRLIATHFRQ